MPNTLRFILRLTPHPHPHAPGADGEAWGEVALSWRADAMPVLLLKTQWDLLPLAEWFADHQDDLCHETWLSDDLLWKPHPGESLTEALQRSQVRLFSDEEKNEENEVEERWQEKIFAFRQTHSLRFALRGASVPAILIGCNYGAGEVSGGESVSWSHAFDMEDFCRATQQALRDVMAQWLAQTRPEPARKRAEKAWARLEEAPVVVC